MTEADGTHESDPKHLEFIQAVIARMAGASGLAKAWCLTVTTAALGYAVANESTNIAWLGVFAGLMFGLLDARYLREERKFRWLYEDARKGRIEVFDMHAHAYGDRRSADLREECRWRFVLRSWSLWGFYGPILLVAAFVLLTGRSG